MISLDAAFAAQLSRVVNETPIEQEIRRRRFIAAKGETASLTARNTAELEPHHVLPHYDSVKAGYARLRILYE